MKWAKEFAKPYFEALAKAVAAERAKKEVFPPAADVFTAFNLTPLNDVRVVIIGQDPYHGDGQAHGLCFSVQRHIAVPPSLKNIYTEMLDDVPGFKRPSHGNLEAWARRGVFLLNATLTVRAHEANSHAKLADCGWQKFTDAVIKAANAREAPTVFILWCAPPPRRSPSRPPTRSLCARQGWLRAEEGQVDQPHAPLRDRGGAPVAAQRHEVPRLQGAPPPKPHLRRRVSLHPGRRPQVFSKANAFLEKKGCEPIDWTIPA